VSNNVAIIGAGWSGLIAAFKLVKAGVNVTILEAAPQAGGRARSINFAHNVLDNGQHICLGAYKTLIATLQELEIDASLVFHQHVFTYLAYHKNQKTYIQFPKIIYPLNLIVGLFSGKNLKIYDKIRIFLLCAKIKLNIVKTKNLSVADFLIKNQQSPHAILHFWEPIALGAMTTKLPQASAEVFVNVIQRFLGFKRKASDWLLFKSDLSEVFVEKITSKIQELGGVFFYHQNIKKLIKINQSWQIDSAKNSFHAQHVIVTIPPWNLAKLLNNSFIGSHLARNLEQLVAEKIITLYLEFDQPITLSAPLIGFIGATAQWVFSRSITNQANLLAIVISSPDNLTSLNKENLLQAVLNDLKQLKKLPTLLNYKIIQEKRAAFCCDIQSQKLRPSTQTNMDNFWLAGDYVANNLPATLEGALINGVNAAGMVLKNYRLALNQFSDE